MAVATIHLPTLSELEARQIVRANATMATPVVFVGSPWLPPTSADLNPWTEARVGSINPDRGPLLIISADADQTVPWQVAYASFERERGNSGVTEIVKMNGRGHSLTIDHGWREVADTALAFLRRFS